MPRWWTLSCALALFFVMIGRASAHDVRATAVLLDIGEEVIEAELQLPLDQLSAAIGAPPSLPASNDTLSAYILRHFSLEARDARPFRSEISSIGMNHIDDADCVIARVTLRAPPGGSARWFELHDDAILHRVVTHDVYVFVRRDLQNAVLGEAPELVGLLHYQKTSLIVDRRGGSRWRGFQAVFGLGMRHIAEGTDHLLFLLMLLVTAPLVAQGQRWNPAGSSLRGFQESVKIVTAFTLGHSLTLIAIALSSVPLPSRIVEVLIAASVLVSASHVLRPLFPGRESLMAGGFGLVHGLGFAAGLNGFGFDRATLSLSVLGFNLGVEAMQLALVALAMPLLVLARRSKHFQLLRISGGVFGCLASAGWLAERALAP